MNFLKKKSSKYSKLNDKDNELKLNDNELKLNEISVDLDDKEDNYIIVECPHCFMKIMVLKKDFNCKIFRHGVYKSNGKQINPHMKKKQCDKLAKNNKIYGCGKPYKLQVIKTDNEILYFTEVCGYI